MADAGRPAPLVPAAGHRPHLDGLRAVAVYLVVAFHAGVAPLSGGFIGVDLFFVLSGYLVTSILLRDVHADGHIHLVRFYARRTRRLLPAATATLVVTAAAYASVASPAEVDAAAGGFRAAALYFSNWYFITTSTDYFAADVGGSPVLHFWSLSVEEQYYLLWPLAFGVACRLARRWTRWRPVVAAVVATGAVASLGWALTLRDGSPAHAYFGTDARAYQLLAGALLAIALVGRSGRHPGRWHRAGAVAAPAGLGLLVLASTTVLGLDPVERGVVAAVAALATVAGLEAGAPTPVTRVLAWRPVAALGRISYGTYLWHWPVIVLLGEAGAELRPLLLAPVAAVAATAVAALSHRYLESPIRSSGFLDRRPALTVVAGVAATLVVGLVVLPQLTSGPGPGAAVLVAVVATVAVVALGVRAGRSAGAGRRREARLALSTASCAVLVVGFVAAAPEPATSGDEAVDWRSAKEDVILPVDCTATELAACVVGDGDGPTVMMIGDSHAAMFSPMLTAMSEDLGVRTVVASRPACPWFVGVSGILWAEACLEHKLDWYDEVIDHFDPDLVLLVHRRWDEPRAPGNLNWVGHAIIEADDPAFAAFVADRTEETVEALGDRAVVIVEGVPMPSPGDPPIDCLSRGSDPAECAFEASPTGPEELAYRAVADADPDDRLTSLDIDDLVCPAHPRCDAVVDGMVRMADASHLTATYARSLGPAFGELLVGAGLLDEP